MKLLGNLKKWYWIPMMSVALSIATLVTLLFPYKVQVSASESVVSISFGNTIIRADPFIAPTLVFHSGFEMGTTGEYRTVVGSPTVVTSPTHTGTYSMNCTTSSSTAYVDFGSYLSSLSFYLYIGSAPSTNITIAGDAVYVNLRLTTSRKIDIYDASTLKIQGNTVLSYYTWYRISVSPTGDGAHGYYWINGQLEGDSGAIVSGLVRASVGVITTSTVSLLFDDVAFSQRDGLDNGDIRTVISVPDAAGDVANFDTPVGSATHWQNVDELPAVLSDADYNEQAGSTQVWDLYKTQNCTTLSISNIVAINILARMKTSNTASTAGISAKNNGYTVNQTFSTTTTITWYKLYYANQINATGTTPWTDTAFNNLQVGAMSTGTTRDTFLYAEWVMVAYAVAPNPISSFTSPSQTSDSIYLTWTKGANSDNTLIRHRSDGTYPTSITDGTLSYNGTASSVNVTGLSSGTTYKFRAWGYSSTLDLYSSNVDLTQATAVGGAHAITNAPPSKDMGVLQPNTLYYAKGTAPNNPVVDSDCTFTLTNTGSDNVDIDIHGHNFTGGVGWTLISGVPSTNEVRIEVYKLGDNPTSDNKTLTTSDQEFISNLGTGGHTHWDFSMQIGTPTDGVQKTGIITLTARAVS